jgi:hypothetical protein
LEAGCEWVVEDEGAGGCFRHLRQCDCGFHNKVRLYEFRARSELDGFKDDVSVGGRVTCSDEADGLWNEFFEIIVSETSDFNFWVESFEAIEMGIKFSDNVIWIST